MTFSAARQVLDGFALASRRNPKSAPGFSKCTGSTECRVPYRTGIDAPLITKRGRGEPGKNWGHEVPAPARARCHRKIDPGGPVGGELVEQSQPGWPQPTRSS